MPHSRLPNRLLSGWRLASDPSTLQPQATGTGYLVDDFGTGARFVAAIGEAGDVPGHHPRASIGNGHVDLRLTSDDAI